MIDRLPLTDLSLGSPSSCYSFLWAAASPWPQWSQCHRAGQTPSTHSCSNSPGTGHLPLQMAGQWSQNYQQTNQVISCIWFNVSIYILYSNWDHQLFFSNFEKLNIYRSLRRLTQWPRNQTDQTVHVLQMCSHTDCGWTWGFLSRPAGFCYRGWSLHRPLWTG